MKKNNSVLANFVLIAIPVIALAILLSRPQPLTSAVIAAPAPPAEPATPVAKIHSHPPSAPAATSEEPQQDAELDADQPHEPCDASSPAASLRDAGCKPAEPRPQAPICKPTPPKLPARYRWSNVPGHRVTPHFVHFKANVNASGRILKVSFRAPADELDYELESTIRSDLANMVLEPAKDVACNKVPGAARLRLWVSETDHDVRRSSNSTYGQLFEEDGDDRDQTDAASTPVR